MCGIIGIYYCNGRPVSQDEIILASDALFHRGPDDSGYLIDKNIGLAVRRLSIIDITGGRQPIFNEIRNLSIVFNGEIFNYMELRDELIRRGHTFSTRSDTEVILHLYEEYGQECLRHLKGMFAFCIYDFRDRTFFIVRDRLGIKPLFYIPNNEGFFFSSEIKGLLKNRTIRKAINIDSLSNFLTLGYTPGPETIIEGIYSLPPGHFIKVSDSGYRIEKYWDIKLKDSYEDRQIGEYIEEFNTVFSAAVKRALVSDVPVGIYLSGGIDSNAILYEMARHTDKVVSFTVTFENKSYDEGVFGSEIAKRFNSEHHEIKCTPGDIVENFSKIVYHLDTLLSNPAAIPQFFLSKEASKKMKVVLSGGGGDELFMGYPTYQADFLVRYYGMLPTFIKKTLEKGSGLLPVSFKRLSLDYRIKKFFEGAKYPLEKAHYWWRTIITEDEKARLLRNPVFSDTFSVYKRYFDCSKDAFSFYDRATYADLKVWWAEMGLIEADSMGMANSIEVRPPFMDHELVEFAFTVPPAIKMKNLRLKYFLTKALKGRLPDKVLRRKKMGFHLPLADWICGELKGFVEERLLSSIMEEFFNTDYITDILREHLQRKRDNNFKIWNLVTFAEWYNQFMK